MKKLTLAAVLGASLLAGCSSTQHLKQSDKLSEARADEASSYLEQMRQGNVTSHVRVVEEGHYMPIRQVSSDRPTIEPVNCDVEYNPVMPASLQEIGQAISESCNVLVRVTPDAASAVDRMANRKRDIEGSESTSMQGDGSIPSPLMAMQNLPMVGGSRERGDLVSIAWSGPVEGLLDAVTSRLGLSWRHRDGVVSIFHLDTRIYRVQAIPSTSRMESTVHSGARSSAGVSSGTSGGSRESSGGISGSSGSSQLTSVEVSTDFMDDLQETVSQMLTPDTGRMALSRASGTLSVTDTPETLDRVGLYVDQLNEFTTKQVLLNVKVLNVTLNSNDEMGINWNAIYTSLADQYGLRLSNAINASSEAVSGSVSILEGNSRFSGSELIVSALAQVGKVSVVTQPSVTTLNLEPVPVQVARQVSYLERVELGQTAQVGSTTSLTPGSVTTGFNMMLLPHILDDSSTVLLQYSMNLSTLDNLRTVSSGGSTIEIPEIDNRIFNQKVRLRSNETLIISGFEQLANDTRRSGVGSARFWPLGGGARGSTRRDVIVVLITPVVIA